MNDPQTEQRRPAPTDRRAMLAGLGGLAAGALLVSKAQGGPLNPPAGPIAPTPGPEPRVAINATNTPGDANSLFRITQPGSYYLTGNVTGEAGKSGIEISSSRVSIDLNGFSVIGVTGSLAGITTDQFSTRNNIVVRNGIVTSWDGDGVHLETANPATYIVEDLIVLGNEGDGIYARNGLVRNCHVGLNTADGISDASTVIGCVARDNGSIGIQCSSGGTVSDCSSFGNGSYGIYGGNTSTITRCSAYDNGSYGIIVFGDGLVSDCSASLNAGGGINGQAGAMILNCVASDNTGDGIVVLNGSLVRGNTCRGNSSDGIFVSAFSGNRIEGNNMTANGRGLRVSGPGNIITGNTCSGNTVENWNVVAGNKCLVVNGVNSGAVTGNAGGVSPGSTNPFANYTY